MPKNKNGGLVTTAIMGVGGLIIAVIVMLVVISTISNANMIGNDKVNSYSVTNESSVIVAGVDTISVKTLPYFTGWNATKVINGSATTSITNETLVEGRDYTIQSYAGTITNLTQWYGGKARVTYAYTITNTNSKDAVTNLTGNFTLGINNVSAKVPTILLIVAVVFLFGALVLLIRNAQTMGIFGSNGQGSL